MAQLDGLVDAGNTVIVVEHDMRVVAAATGSSTSAPAPATRAAASSTTK
jgi:excinuclease ABC subunit A